MLSCKYQWNKKCKKARRYVQNIWIYADLNQHLIVLKSDRVSINKILVTEFVTAKISESKFNVKYVNTVKPRTSNVWNKTLEDKSIAKDHRMRKKWTEYKIFELKYGNTKLSNVLKYNQLKYLQFLFLFISTKLALNYINQAWCNYKTRSRWRHKRLGAGYPS